MSRPYRWLIRRNDDGVDVDWGGLAAVVVPVSVAMNLGFRFLPDKYMYWFVILVVLVGFPILFVYERRRMAETVAAEAEEPAEPIVLIDGEDVVVFRTTREAEEYLEPEDASSGAVELFDAEGRALAATVDPERTFRGQRFTRIDLQYPPRSEATRVRRALETFAHASGILGPEEMSTTRLLALLAEAR